MTEEQTKRYLAAIESIAASLKIVSHETSPWDQGPEPNTAPAWVMEQALAEASLCLCKTCIAHRAKPIGALGAA